MKILALTLLLLAASTGVNAFAPPTKVAPFSVLPIVHHTKTSKPLVAPLHYRVLDKDQDDENDPVALKLLSRAPPRFQMRQALEESSAPRDAVPVQWRSAINTRLVKALRANQYVILALATIISALVLLVTQGPDAFSHLNEIVKWTGGGSGLFDFKVSTESLLMGIGGAMPLLAFSNFIESSDKRTFANLNFSTIVLCMTLFGRRTVPPDDFLPPEYKSAGGALEIPTTKSWQALVESLSLATVTGFCEESVFRRQVPAVLAQISGANGNILIPFFGQALLFGLGHIQPSQKVSENAIMVGLQSINGLGFGLLLLLSGGQLVVPMIAHATYDFVTFFKTWNDANSQLEYAEKMYSRPLPPHVEKEVESVVRSNPKMKDPRVFKSLKRLFFIFDYDKNESLNLSEVKKGISYYALEKQSTPPSDTEIERLFQSTVQSRKAIEGVSRSRLNFPDFLRLYSTMTTGGGRKQPKNFIESVSQKVKAVKKEVVEV